MATNPTAEFGPAQVRQYSPNDPLTNASVRGELLLERLEAVGAVPRGRVLDLGCGYGGLTLALRAAGWEVVSADRDVENLEVVRDRLKDNDLSLDITNASAVSLPYRDESFGTVIMVGVLEWVGFSDPDADPRQMQIDALREVRRVLRPDGTLLLATKNRLFPRFAWSDAQLEMPLVNVLPRRVADAVVRRRRGYGYRSRIYSATGWNKLMSDAGLDPTGGWVPRYNYQYPLAMLPFGERGSLRREAEDRAAALGESERREALTSTSQGLRGRYFDLVESLGLHRLLGASLILSARRPG